MCSESMVITYLAYGDAALWPSPEGTCALDIVRARAQWDSRGYRLAGITAELAHWALGIYSIGKIKVGLGQVRRYVGGGHMGREEHSGTGITCDVLRNAEHDFRQEHCLKSCSAFHEL